MYWGFFFRLLGGSFLAPILFSFMLAPLYGLVALTARNGGAKPSPASYLMLGLVFVGQLYFWAGWAAYCAALAVIRTSDPAVTYA